jgi:dihydroflavonol-4-reductase
MKTVVVTGAAGFIGAHLAVALAKAGNFVRALDLLPRPSSLTAAGVPYTRADVCDEAGLRRIFEGADVVHHLASAHLEVTRGEAHYRRVNVDAAAAVVRACAAVGVRRLVHTSTVGVYGHVASPPADEASTHAPGNTYERTKLEGERAVREEARRTGLDVVVLQPAWVYGSGCPRLARLLRSVARGRFVYIGQGRNLRHPVHIDDAIAAFRCASAASPAAAGGTYIIAGPRYLALREVVEACAHALGVKAPRRRLPRSAAWALGLGAELAFRGIGREPPISRRSLAFFENDNAYSTAAAATAIGFVPAVEFDEGLRRVLAVSAGAGAVRQASSSPASLRAVS